MEKSSKNDMHSICADCVEYILKSAMAKRSLDNITLVIIAFNNLHKNQRKLYKKRQRNISLPSEKLNSIKEKSLSPKIPDLNPGGRSRNTTAKKKSVGKTFLIPEETKLRFDLLNKKAHFSETKPNPSMNGTQNNHEDPAFSESPYLTQNSKYLSYSLAQSKHASVNKQIIKTLTKKMEETNGNNINNYKGTGDIFQKISSHSNQISNLNKINQINKGSKGRNLNYNTVSQINNLDDLIKSSYTLQSEKKQAQMSSNARSHSHTYSHTRTQSQNSAYNYTKAYQLNHPHDPPNPPTEKEGAENTNDQKKNSNYGELSSDQNSKGGKESHPKPDSQDMHHYPGLNKNSSNLNNTPNYKRNSKRHSHTHTHSHSHTHSNSESHSDSRTGSNFSYTNPHPHPHTQTNTAGPKYEHTTKAPSKEAHTDSAEYSYGNSQSHSFNSTFSNKYKVSHTHTHSHNIPSTTATAIATATATAPATATGTGTVTGTASVLRPELNARPTISRNTIPAKSTTTNPTPNTTVTQNQNALHNSNKSNSVSAASALGLTPTTTSSFTHNSGPYSRNDEKHSQFSTQAFGLLNHKVISHLKRGKAKRKIILSHNNK
jgi:hypothetical protein